MVLTSGNEFAKKTAREKLDEVTSRNPMFFFIFYIAFFTPLFKPFDFCSITVVEEKTEIEMREAHALDSKASNRE
jgi:hypothetical protein